jgi:hypothetical protein
MLGFHPLAGAPIAASGAGENGVTGSIVATVSVVAAIDAEFTVSGFDIDAVAVIGLVASIAVAHGVACVGAASVAVSAGLAAAHGVAGAGVGQVTLAANIAAIHERYELRGEVRVGGVLVNRRVRAHRRDTGALTGEGDTVAGRFRIHTGFVPAEHYIVPVHLDDAATDWLPSVANRVLSVLAQDV